MTDDEQIFRWFRPAHASFTPPIGMWHVQADASQAWRRAGCGYELRRNQSFVADARVDQMPKQGTTLTTCKKCLRVARNTPHRLRPLDD